MMSHPPGVFFHLIAIGFNQAKMASLKIRKRRVMVMDMMMAAAVMSLCRGVRLS